MSISALGIAQRLEAHGFSKFQAEGIAEKLVKAAENRDLVTKNFYQLKWLNGTGGTKAKNPLLINKNASRYVDGRRKR